MSGYIGTKSVTLSTTSASVGGDSTVGGDLTVDTNTLYVDSTNNRVGVGTVSPSYLFHASGSGDAVAAVTAGATSIAALNLGNSTNLADGGIRYDNSADALIFRSANAERLRILSSGGITFNGDTAAANALDDYEEGTWTPTSLVNGFTVSLSNFNAARYVKIGKIVHVTFDMVFGSATYASSFSHVGGLPFGSATSAVNGFYSSGTISGNASGGPIYIGSGTTSVYLFQGINSNTTTTWNAGFTYETT